MPLTPAEILEATEQIEAEKEEKQRFREEKKFLREQRKKNEVRDKLLAPFLLIVTLLISAIVMMLSSY